MVFNFCSEADIKKAVDKADRKAARKEKGEKRERERERERERRRREREGEKSILGVE